VAIGASASEKPSPASKVAEKTGSPAAKPKPPPAAAPKQIGKAERPESLEPGAEAAAKPPPEELLTLNFYQTDIRELLSALAMQRELNIVLSQEVTGNVSVQLHKMTLIQALDAISLAGDVNYSKSGGVYYFYKPREKKDPEADNLEMRVFRLKYAEVDKVQEILDAIPGLRMMKIHEPSKTLIAEDTPENIEKIESMIGYWDAKPKQVLIEAQILEVTLTDDMALGVDWQQVIGEGAIGTAGFSRVPVPTAPNTVPVPGGEGASFVGSIITGVGSSTQFAAALNALQSKTKVNTLSTPKILAIHGQAATVQVGGQQGYQVSTASEGIQETSVEFIPTGTTLNITPWIDDDSNVMLDVRPEISSATLSADGIPTVKTTNVSTWLLARSGQTVFMGGLIQDTTSRTQQMVPCLGAIPAIGSLFSRSVSTGSKTELVVLITPKVVGVDDRQGQRMKRQIRRLEKEMEIEDQASPTDIIRLIEPGK